MSALIDYVPPPRPPNEAERQRATEALGVLDTPPDQALDDLVWLATHITGASIAVVGLMDNDRQWIKACCGFAGTEAPRDLTLCAHTLLGTGLFEIEDASSSPQYAANPFIAGEPHVRFYAGVSLVGKGGHAYGTLCVADSQPRRLSSGQREAMVRLARQATTLLEMQQERATSLANERALNHLLESMPDGVVSCDAHGVLTQFNATAREWHGVDPRDAPPETWAEHFDLFAIDGSGHLPTEQIPLLRAFNGKVVRDAPLVIRAQGRADRTVLCNASRLVGTDGALLGAVCQMRDVTALQHAEARVRDSELRLRSILQNSLDAFVAIEDDGTVADWNRAAEAMFGWSRHDATGRPLADLILPGAQAADDDALARLLSSGGVRGVEERIELTARRRDGQTFPVAMTINAIQLGTHRVRAAFLHDISSRVEAQVRLHRSEWRLRAITDHAPALIAHVGPDLRFSFVNEAFREWYGVDPASLLGSNLRDLVGAAAFAGMQDSIRDALAGQRVGFDAHRVLDDGTLRHSHTTMIPDPESTAGLIGSDKAGRGFHLLVHNVSAHRRLAHVLAEQALRDELTGLPNRAAWREELQRGLARASRLGTPAAVMFLDLDGFKSINDTHGHAAGDHVLKAFAALLRASLRASDLVARLSGDEFVVLLDRVADVEGDPPRVAAKILQAARDGVMFNGVQLSIQPSIGIAIQRGPKFDAEALVRRADEAMYAAKRQKNGVVEVYESRVDA